ncbi:MAG TPA: hypothetical protein VHW60_15830 [Caulobacteraceae bacterium]|jgi:hypothetical protein|nr:hypothetical protein [Caulobacteraceae bacterium]
MSFLPPSTNADYRGSRLSVWFLGLAALLTIGPGLVHTLLPDGGMGVIAGLRPGAAAPLVLGVFRWEGATQLALGLAMLVVALRYRPLTPLFLALLALETGISVLYAWVLAPPVGGHRPPENYGVLVVAPLAVVFLALSLRDRSAQTPRGV